MIRDDVEVFGNIWADIEEATEKTKKSFGEKVFDAATKLIKENPKDFQHVAPPEEVTLDSDSVSLSFNIYPDEYQDEDTIVDGAYFDKSFGNYLPNERVIRTLVWDFSEAEDELKKLSDLLDEKFPGENNPILASLFDFETDDLPEAPQDDAEEYEPEPPDYWYDDRR